MKTKLLLGAGIGACALAWAAKDPVIMTVDGVDVPLSEFEYLYHKNSQQQLTPQPIGEYVELFKNYRLKVADAMAAGIDTTASFRQEVEQYRRDLAAPYLADSLFLNKLVKEAYDRSLEEVESSHIMLFKSAGAEDNAKAIAFLDSLKEVARQGGDFAKLAERYSQDRGTNSRGGSLGYIVAGRYPYSYEITAYALKPGEISEVIESPVAFHVLKGGVRRPAKGQVHVSHILLMDPRDGNQAALEANHNKIDSLYNILKADPRRFEALAMDYSDDQGSARQGGLLPWFGTGQMVEEFETRAFDMPVGAVSEPFRTRYGWHIIYKLDQKGVAPLEEMKAQTLQRITSPTDERFEMVKQHQNEVLAKKHKGILNKDLLSQMRTDVGKSGIDSTFYSNYAAPELANLKVGSIGKKNYTVADLTDSFHGSLQPEPDMALKLFDQKVTDFFNKHLVEAEEVWLEANEPDYSNLLHEYTNGSLLYEISLQKVWDKASKDTDALAAYFDAHKAEYAWKEPRAKGILVQAKNDSIGNAAAMRYLELTPEEALPTLRKEFKGEATFDRVLAPKGVNAMVDNLMFGEGPATPSNANYTVYFMLDGRVITEPEDVADVRGQVTSDLQETLEEAWIRELREKYPVTINQKVLKKVK